MITAKRCPKCKTIQNEDNEYCMKCWEKGEVVKCKIVRVDV